jgi:hypothetical protein
MKENPIFLRYFNSSRAVFSLLITYLSLQQVWEKFQRIGHEMVDLATSLSCISTDAVEKQVAFNFILI